MDLLFLFFISSGLFLGWSLGASDASNIFGTAIATRMIRFNTAALIASFIEENGYKVSSPLTKEITIPSEFSDVYEKYNELQRRQGFDLRRHKGKSAVSYTFNVIGYVDKSGKPDSDVQIHIIVCDGKIVAADIASTKLDGFMEGIRKPWHGVLS